MSKNYTYVLGQNNYDCGIACIMTILYYYGIRVSRETIVSSFKKQDNGYTAYDLLQIARKYGVTAYGVKSSICDIKSFPVIAHTMKDKSMFHFIVIFERNDNKKTLMVMDPSEGIKTITFEEFNHITTNIFLVFNNSQFKKLKNKRFRVEIIRIIQSNKRIILRTLIFSVLYTLVSLAFNYYLKTMLKYYNNISFLFWIFVIFVQIAIIKNYLFYIKNIFTYNLSMTIDKNITMDTISHIFNLPYKYFVSKTTGELVTIIEDIENFKQIVTKIFVLSLVDFILILFVLSYLVLFNSWLALFCLVLLIILLFITKRYQYVFNNYYVKFKRNRINYTSSLISYLTSYETIKNLNISQKISNTLFSKYNNSLLSEEKYNKKYYIYTLIISFLVDFFYLALILFILFLVNIKTFTILDVVLFSSVYYLMIGLLNNINEGISLYKVYETSIDRVLDVLEVKPEIFNKTYLSRISHIKFHNVCYQINDISVLKNITLTCNTNDRIYITGSSGLGKSSLMKLLLRYYECTDGRISIDGIDINNLELSFIRDAITYIGQNENLFLGSIKDNLNIISDSYDEIQKVSRITLLDDFFVKNKTNYDYLIEESGSNLSGGERKKIILARGLLKFKEVLILDEIFNEISVEEERKILKNIFDEYHNKIIIVISHRNTNLDLFNKKYCLEGDGMLHEIK